MNSLSRPARAKVRDLRGHEISSAILLGPSRSGPHRLSKPIGALAPTSRPTSSPGRATTPLVKAIRFHRYGGPDVLRYEEVADPRPGRGEIRVRVHAAALNPKDVLTRMGKMRLFDRPFPQSSGQDLAGVVDAVGPGVRSLRVGEAVFGMIRGFRGGACAELALVAQDHAALAPRGISLVEAAGLPLAGMTALQALRDRAAVRPGDAVALNGASGGVGVFAVQIAKILGARVTAVCSARNADFVRELGADEVLPYDELELVRRERRFDAVFDIFGTAPYDAARHLLAPGGRHVTAIPTRRALWRDAMSRAFGSPARMILVRPRTRELTQLGQWVEEGKLRPVVDRTWSLERVAEAHAYLETKRARGKVVIEVAGA